MGNPFKLFFRVPGYDEDVFVGPDGLNYRRVEELGFKKVTREEADTGGFVVFRRPNELGGFDYFPLVDRFFPGCMPCPDPEKDRWLEGYDKGVVLFVLGEAKNRQYVKHSGG